MDREDHKTFIPGVGFLVTSWDGSESHIFPIEEEVEPMNINELVTLDNAVAWDNADNPHAYLLGLLGAQAPIETVLELRNALEQELMEAEAAENDGQPSHYEEMQDYFGGDDFPEQWDEGYDDGGGW